MCLIVKKGTKEKIAKNDIVCYKNVFLAGSGRIISNIQDFEYKLGKLYTATFSIVDDKLELAMNCWWADDISALKYSKYFIKQRTSDLVAYNRGFHSYKSRERDGYNRIPNVECTIPKGTKYIEDETGLICSEAIIITKILE